MNWRDADEILRKEFSDLIGKRADGEPWQWTDIIAFVRKTVERCYELDAELKSLRPCKHEWRDCFDHGLGETNRNTRCSKCCISMQEIGRMTLETLKAEKAPK